MLGLASAAAIAGSILAATKIFDNADAAQNAPFTGSIPFASGFAPSVSSGELPGYLEEKNGNIINKLTGQVVGKSKGVTSAVESANIVTNAFNAGTFKKAESATTPPIINVTVNGAIDKEGTARRIVDTLNNSYYRGTGGANNLQVT